MIEFKINKIFPVIFVDDGTGTKRWLLPAGIITEDENLPTQEYKFKSKEDAERFLKNWKPAPGFISKINAEFYAAGSECQALDCAIEHWKQVYLDVIEGDKHIGPETCALCIRSKRIKLITDSACAKCILNGYKETTYADRIGNYYFLSCCAEYQAFVDEASTEHALAMLNTLVGLRNDKYGHATYTQFGTIKNTTEVRSTYQQEGQKIVQDVLNAKSNDVVAVPKGMTAFLRADFEKVERFLMGQLMDSMNLSNVLVGPIVAEEAPVKQYVFKPGDVVDRPHNNEVRIIVDLGYFNNPRKKVLGAIDVDGTIRATSIIGGTADNFKYCRYVKRGKLRPGSDFILQPVKCNIIAGDVVITNWGITTNELRIAVDDKDGVDLYTFGGRKVGWIKKNGDGDIGYCKVGRIEDFIN